MVEDHYTRYLVEQRAREMIAAERAGRRRRRWRIAAILAKLALVVLILMATYWMGYSRGLWDGQRGAYGPGGDGA